MIRTFIADFYYLKKTHRSVYSLNTFWTYNSAAGMFFCNYKKKLLLFFDISCIRKPTSMHRYSVPFPTNFMNGGSYSTALFWRFCFHIWLTEKMGLSVNPDPAMELGFNGLSVNPKARAILHNSHQFNKMTCSSII